MCLCRKRCVCLCLLACAWVAMLPTLAMAADPVYKAGTAAFKAGQKGIVVTFPVPMPSSRYTVSVQATNTSGYSSVSKCTYFNVLKKTNTNFQVQHKTCDDGKPIALDKNVSLDWIAIGQGFSVLRERICYDGRILSYQGQPVGCIYNADEAVGREDELCGGEHKTALKGRGYGLRVPERLGGGVMGCLVCIHGDRPGVLDVLKPGPYPEGFSPGVSCLGHFRFEPVRRID